MDQKQVADELYAVRPAEFIRLRDARAREARASGDRELAGWIKALRRPVMSAWALNLVVRSYPEEIGRLIALGAQLREAQSRLAGEELQQLGRRRREVLAEVVSLARHRAAEFGHLLGDTAESEALQTLHSALVDPAVADALRAGQLVSPLSYTGLGPLGAGPDATRPETSSPRIAQLPAEAGSPSDDERRRRQRDHALATLRDAESRAAQAAATLQDAELQQERATSHREDLEQRIGRLAEQLRELTEQLRQREAEAVQAVREERSARHARDVADRAQRAARSAVDRARADVED